ncbi:MAG TPA: ABC transporter permease subunit [Bacillota bacterium]|nr:ABC transporter permease subunit [Bacillota bacterium]
MRLLNLSKPYRLLLPSLLFFLVFTLMGAVLVLVQSLEAPGGTAESGFDNYIRLLHSADFYAAAGITLRIGLLSTVLSLLFGTAIARYLSTYAKAAGWTSPVWLPLMLPHFAAAYIMVLLLAPSGWVSGALYQLGLLSAPSQFPVLINDQQGIGIILAYLWKEVPFVVLMLMPVFQLQDRRYTDVVRTLGGGEWEVFKTVQLPMLAPVLVETGLLIFAFIFSAFEVPYLLGVTYPKMLPVMAFRLFYAGDWSSRPEAMAVMTVTTAVILVIALVIVLLMQTRRYRTMRGR